MHRIKDAFHNKKAFIVYLMAGDPTLALSAEYILAAQEAGADMVEIGIPFSDPIAEGEVIQAASIRALGAGARLDGVFDMVSSIKSQMRIPVVFMTYLNPVFVYGYDPFFARCADEGVCGIIIPDLPFEEQGEVKAAAGTHGVEVVSLVAPTSGKRIPGIARNAEGFIYLVSSMGVTGFRSVITTNLQPIVSEIKTVTNVPVAVGFGISTPEQASHVAGIADGVIVGSAAVRIVGEHGANAHRALREYIGAMKNGMPL
ncbi:MAG: tryptophan synthase subunit alpha [Oscillospiraceae bacterium]|nr:tryptophan synthase subunit alpha [Oscillospiraceae bacterium]